MYLSVFAGTFLFLWIITKYQTPVAAGIALIIAMLFFGTMANPAVTMMSYFAGSLSQSNMFKTVLAQLLAAYTITRL